jgi:hypothetical protein
MGLGFRAAFAAERDGSAGSRVLCGDGKALVVARPAPGGEHMHFSYWKMADGWAAMEHPRRRETTLYLFDKESAPHLTTWLGAGTITLEPDWPVGPVRPEQSVGYALALCAGEICGASADGVWVAARTTMPGGGVRCALVARLRHVPMGTSAAFTLGGRRARRRCNPSCSPASGPSPAPRRTSPKDGSSTISA